MVVDIRRDHTFRVPRPDVSAKLGTPNACTDCHRDKPAEWAAAAVEQWFGPYRKGLQNYGPAFHAARTDAADAAGLLGVLATDGNAPAVVRASALSELGALASPSNIDKARTALADPDPMVRIGALEMLERVPPAQAWPLAAARLSDPVRGVRIRAASLLASVPTASQLPADRTAFDRAAAEFVAAQRSNADRPEAHTALGNFLAQRGATREAEAEYKTALKLSPQFAAAAINLADLYRQTGRDDEGEIALRAALPASPREASLHHALGLTLTRLKQPVEALAELQKAVELEPGHARTRKDSVLRAGATLRRAASFAATLACRPRP